MSLTQISSSHVDHTLAALAEPTRRGVIDLLRQRPRPAGELAAACSVSPPAMSRHLRILRTYGLVEEARGDPKDSRLRIYRLRRQPFLDLRAWLDQVESFWTDQLGAFKQHVERTGKGKHS